VFSVIAKTNKGHRYYYLRKPQRVGSKVRPKDIYLGRMDADAVPPCVFNILRANGRKPMRITAQYGYKIPVQVALGWWREIDDARGWLPLSRRKRLGPKDQKLIVSAFRKVVALSDALESNKATAKRKNTSFFR
jgi:hypothetical protein